MIRKSIGASLEKFGKNLIVVPAVLIDQWTQQANKYFPQLTIYQYISGQGKKSIKKEELLKYDIVLISYDMVRNDVDSKNDKSNLLGQTWM